MIDDQPTENKTRSDRTLLRRFRTGEQDAATALYLRYADRLNRLAQSKTSRHLQGRSDPEGIVQSVFRTFFRRAAIGQYDVPDGEQLWKLFLVIALNKIRDAAAHHGAAKRDAAKTRTLDIVRDGGECDDGQQAESLAVLRMTVEDLLGTMTPSQQEIVQLRIAGYPVNEIAVQTQRSQRSVERWLQKFRTELAARIRHE